MNNLMLNDKVEVTKRQYEVLELLSDGLTNSQIAEKLVVSKRTVESHVSDMIYRSDGLANNRTQLVILFLKNKIIKMENKQIDNENA